MASNNNTFPSREQVDRVRAQYPKGTRIEITHIDDPYSKLAVGSRGTVEYIDDARTLFCAFDNGEHIGLLSGIDGYIKAPVMGEKVKKQILTLRTLSGCPNMFDTNAVQRFAFDNGFYELVDFIRTDRKAYADFILTGKTK